MATHLKQSVHRSLRLLLARLARGPARAERRGPIDTSDTMGGAVRDAELLVAFAAQSNRKVTPGKATELIEAAVDVSSALSSREGLTAAQRARFWTAYEAVAVEMAPLSAHSIRTSLRLNATPAFRSIFTHLGVNAWLALIVFFMCVALQVFWVAGKDLVERSDSIARERIELQKKMLENAVAIQRTSLQMNAKMCALSGQPLAGLSCTGSQAAHAAKIKTDAFRLVALGAELELLQGDVSEKDLRGSEMLVVLRSIRARSKPVETLLERWHSRVERVCRVPLVDYVCLGDQRPPPQTASAVVRSSFSEMRRQLASPNTRSTQVPLMLAGLDEWERTLAEDESFERMVVEIRLIVANLGNYLIAMAMGVLGALTFILRTTSQQLREHSYVPVSISMSMVRTCLGAIAGVFGSLLMPNGDPSLKSLPPLFIPFLFGYAIEILFSLMDKLVNNFTQGARS